MENIVDSLRVQFRNIFGMIHGMEWYMLLYQHSKQIPKSIYNLQEYLILDFMKNHMLSNYLSYIHCMSCKNNGMADIFHWFLN